MGGWWVRQGAGGNKLSVGWEGMAQGEPASEAGRQARGRAAIYPAVAHRQR